MLFNSLEFAIFLPIVFLLYWFVFDYALSKYKHQLLLQNLFIVVASYIFYGWWDWRFLILIAITTLLSFLSGIGIEKAPTQRGKKVVMIANIVVNLGILGVYKYYDFFATQFAELFGIESDFLLLHLILPVGISFYTFQIMSYVIDVYRHDAKVQKNLFYLGLYVAFFPQLVAGPIVRFSDINAELHERQLNRSEIETGLLRFMQGLFKKVLIANQVGALWEELRVLEASQISVTTAWLGAACFTLIFRLRSNMPDGVLYSILLHCFLQSE